MSQTSTTKSKYYEVQTPDGNFKVKQCDKNNCGAEIFWDPSIEKFIDLHARNLEKNFHWNYCASNPNRIARPAGTETTPLMTPPPQQQNVYTNPGKPDPRPNLNTSSSSADLQSQGQELLTQERLNRMEENIERINNTVQMLYNVVTAFVEYNPTVKSFEAIIEAMLKYLPEPVLTKPKNAYDILNENDESLGSDDVNPINKFD